MITINGRILENSYTSAQWAASNPILPDRVAGYDSTVKKYKLGDGITNWASLPWWSDYSLPNPTTITVPASTDNYTALTIPSGYHGDSAYVLSDNGDGTFDRDFSRVKAKSDGTFVVMTFNQDTQVRFPN